MCDPLTAALISAGVGIVGTAAAIKGGVDANNNAKDQQAYQNDIFEKNKQYRLEVMQFNNDQYANDLTHYGSTLEYEKEEFGRAKDLAGLQFDNVNKDYTGKLGTVLLRSVQEEIASALGIENVNAQVGTNKGALRAHNADSGVAGNSVDLMEGEVDRQAGAARRAIERNDEATKNQLKLEMLGIKAQRDTSLANITLPSFQPIQPPATPPPVSVVNPAAPVPTTSAAAIALGGVSTGVNLAAGTAALIKPFLMDK